MEEEEEDPEDLVIRGLSSCALLSKTECCNHVAWPLPQEPSEDQKPLVGSRFNEVWGNRSSGWPEAHCPC